MIIAPIERDKVQKLCGEFLKDNGEALNFPPVKNVFLKEPRSIIGYISNPIQDKNVRDLLQHDDIPIYHAFEEPPLKENLNIVCNCMVVGTAGSGKSTLLRALYNSVSIGSPLLDDIRNSEQRDLLSEIHGEYSSKVSLQTGSGERGMARTIRATAQNFYNDDNRLNPYSVIPVDSSGRDWILLADTPGVLDGERDASARFGNWEEGRKRQVNNLKESGLSDHDKIPIHTFQNLNESLSRTALLKCDSFHKIGISDALNKAESGRRPASFDTILVVGSMPSSNATIPFELMSLLNTTTSHIGKDTKFILVLTKSNSTRISDHDNVHTLGSQFANIGNAARSYMEFFTQVYRNMEYTDDEAKDLAKNIKVFYVEFDNKYSYFTQIVAIRKELATRNEDTRITRHTSLNGDIKNIKNTHVPMEELLPWIIQAAGKLADDNDWCYQELACTGHFIKINKAAAEAVESANKRNNSVSTFMDNFDTTFDGLSVLSTIIKNNMSAYVSKQDHIGNLYVFQELSSRNLEDNPGNMKGVIILKKLDFRGLLDKYVKDSVLTLPSIWTSSSIGSNQSNLWIPETENIVIKSTEWVEGRNSLRIQLPNMYYLDNRENHSPTFHACERTKVLNNNIEVQVNFIPNSSVSKICSEIEVTLQNYEGRDVKMVSNVLKGLTKLRSNIKSVGDKMAGLPEKMSKIKGSAAETEQGFKWSIENSSKRRGSVHSDMWEKGAQVSNIVRESSTECADIATEVTRALHDMLSVSVDDDPNTPVSGANTGSVNDIIVDTQRALQQLNSVFDASSEMKNDAEQASGSDQLITSNPNLPSKSIGGRCLYRASIRSSWISVIHGRICQVYSEAFVLLIEYLDNVKTNFISAKDQLVQCFTMLKYSLKMYQNNKIIFESCSCESMEVDKLKDLVDLLGMGANQDEDNFNDNTRHYYQKIKNIVDAPEAANPDDLDGKYDLKPSVATWFTDITESGIKKQKEFMMQPAFTDSFEQITTIQKDQISHFFYSIHLRSAKFPRREGLLIKNVNGSIGYYSSDDFKHESVAPQLYPIAPPLPYDGDRPKVDAKATLLKIHSLVDNHRSILLESLQNFTTAIQQHQAAINQKIIAFQDFHGIVTREIKEKFPSEDSFARWNITCIENIKKIQEDCVVLGGLERTVEDIFYRTKMELSITKPLM